MFTKEIQTIVDYVIAQNQPDLSLEQPLSKLQLQDGRLFVIAIGKASYLMAKKAQEILPKKIDVGIVITKEHYSLGNIEGFTIFEADHPILTERNLLASQFVLQKTQNMQENDDIVFLLSGGGSALFEKPLCRLADLQKVNEQLLKSGADIMEINTIRKCLSAVKGGKFAQWCYPAKIHNFILSDVISDDLTSIASGPTVEDCSSLVAFDINQKYHLNIPLPYLQTEKVTHLTNVESTIISSVKKLTSSAKEILLKLGYQAFIIDDAVSENNLIFARRLLEQALAAQNSDYSIALIYGGETTVKINGNGLGGRNQEIVLACIQELSHFKDTAILSIGSDGTDGPTDAAGGYCDQNTYSKALQQHLDLSQYLANNDSYHALDALNCLIKTGPTNTNVNDLSIILIRRKKSYSEL